MDIKNVLNNLTSLAAATAKKSNVVIANEVLEGKWDSGDTRKQKLTKAGYDYTAIQKEIANLLAKNGSRAAVIANMEAWAIKIGNDNRYSYKTWTSNIKTHQCPVCHPELMKDGEDGWNCIGFAFAIWHHGGRLACNCHCGVIPNAVGERIYNAKTDADALKIARQYIGINDITVIRNNKKAIPKSKAKPGDIGLLFDGNTYKHTFFIMSNNKIADSTGSGPKSNHIRANRNFDGRYVSGLKVIIRYTGNGNAATYKPVSTQTKKTYSGTLPSTKLVKTNAEVINDTVKWAVWIAQDNSFHYGHGKHSHHNGCYFCDTQPSIKKTSGIVDWKKTYCCNPFVGAAWAHGGCIPEAMAQCRKGKSWSFDKGKGYDALSIFTNLKHPAKSKLKKGDVLCKDGHIALYIGKGKLVEAASSDDNKRNSAKWNNSIHIATLTDSRYKGFSRVHRYNGSVNTTAYIRFGEVSKRVGQWQKFLNWWYNGKVGTPDGIFGPNTLKWTKKFQEQQLGKGQGDGIIGPKTIEAAKKVKK